MSCPFVGLGEWPNVTLFICCYLVNRETVDLCQKAERAGVSWISVHGRTKEQRGQPVNLEAIKLLTENVNIPVVANGDIRTMADVDKIHQETRVRGNAKSLHFPHIYRVSKISVKSDQPNKYNNE